MLLDAELEKSKSEVKTLKALNAELKKQVTEGAAEVVEVLDEVEVRPAALSKNHGSNSECTTRSTLRSARRCLKKSKRMR